MTPEVLGHYRIVEKIGQGGMGEVYRAYDQRLERDVAVKILPTHTLHVEAVRRRFRKEALSLSRLNHPNIATVHDFDTQDGMDFLVMEYVPGQTLGDILRDGPLEENQTLDLARQLLDGLDAAHGANVIHRDLKPGNLRITPDGRLKILDFGLAKLVHPDTGDMTATAPLTDTVGAVGTLPYMAPEQLAGRDVDARSDLYAVGAVLYEMVTGQRRYPDAQGAELISAILSRDPRLPSQLNPSVSADLDAVISRALHRDPVQRYQSAKELGAELERIEAGLPVVTPRIRSRRAPWAIALGLLAALAAVSTWNPGGMSRRLPWHSPRLESLAVLPMHSLSTDPEHEILAAGMTGELISELTKIEAWKVRPYQAVRKYQDTDRPLDELGAELGVDVVVQASVVASAESIRVSVQLIDVAAQENLWAESFEHDLHDVLTLYRDLTHAIAQRVHVAVSGEEERVLEQEVREVDPEAYRFYLVARQNALDWNFERAIEFYERSVAVDSTFAPALAGMSSAYGQMVFFGRMSSREARPQAEAALQRALRWSESDYRTQAALANFKGLFEWNLREAVRGFRLAHRLNPGDVEVLTFLATALALEGNFEESLQFGHEAVEIDPLSLTTNTNLGWLYWWSGRPDEALAQYLKVLDLDPDYAYAHMEMAWCYAAKDMPEEACRECDLALQTPRGASDPIVLGRCLSQYSSCGREDDAASLVSDAAARGIALDVDEQLMSNDERIEGMRRQFEKRSPDALYWKFSPRLADLREDPRFVELLAQVDAW